MTLLTRPGPIGFRISASGSQGVDWATLDAIWARAGELDVFDAGWMSDHLSDASLERGGASFEAMTTAAAVAHRVPGKWVGIAVLANTFRHPALVAKAATVIDNVTGGRFILGLGTGWHEGEHEAFGITLPPIRERFDSYERALRVLLALFSADARAAPGVSLDDSMYPLRGATNEPGTVRPGGPSIWLGGQRPRGIALAARFADGWPMPGNRAGDVAYFIDRRDRIKRALDVAGRDPAAFTFAAQVDCGASPAMRRAGLETARAFVRAGADHVMLGVAGTAGPDGLVLMAREVAEPLRDALG